MKRKSNYLTIFIASICLFLAVFIFLLFSHSSQTESDKGTLAIINKKMITDKAFKQRFEQIKKEKMGGLPDNGQVRREILKNMVDEELLIIEAKRRGYDKDEEGKLEKERIEIQELLNAFHKKYIQSTIQVDDEELKDLFIRLNTKIEARHLYAPTKEKADSLYNLLIQGASFETLAKDIFEDPVLRDSGGLLGYFSVDEMEPNFEEVAYQLAIGELSKPVKTTDGYSIIRVENRITKPLITETEYAKSKAKLRSYWVSRKIKKATQEFSDSLRKNLAIKFDKFAINNLFNRIQQHQNGDFLMHFEAENPGKNTMDNPVLATYGDLKWDLKKFQHDAKFTSASQRNWITTREKLQDFLAGLIIRSQMRRIASDDKLHTTTEYGQKVEESWENYLIKRIDGEITKQFIVPEDSVRCYYNQDPNRFAEPAKIRLREIVVSDKRLVSRLIKLLDQGYSFAQLAEEYSERRWTAENGGDLGYLYPEDLGRWANRLFQLQEGQRTEPLEMDSHYIIFECVDKKRSRLRSLQEAYNDVENTLRYIKKDDVRIKTLKKIQHSLDQFKVFPERLKLIRMTNNERGTI